MLGSRAYKVRRPAGERPGEKRAIADGRNEETGGKFCRDRNEPMIIIRDVYKSFGKNHVLRGVNLEVKCGESMVVIGGSGTGKSVLIKCVIGLLRHDRGEIYVDGQEISHLTREGVE